MKTLELLKNVKTIANTKAVKGGVDLGVTAGVSVTKTEYSQGVSVTSISLNLKQ